MALAAVVTIFVGSHEDSGTAGLAGALTAQTVDLAVFVDLVVLEDGEFDLLPLVLDLLGGGVILLLALLGATTEAQHQVQSGLLLDVVVGQGAAIFQLLAGEDQTLLIWRDALLILDFGFDILDRIGRFDLKGDGLARQGLDEDLHPGCLSGSGSAVATKLSTYFQPTTPKNYTFSTKIATSNTKLTLL